MKKKKIILIVIALMGIFIISAFILSQYQATTHAVKPSKLGTLSSMSILTSSLNQQTEVVLTSIKSANSKVALSGLLNLDHEKSIAAGKKDQLEAIHLYSYLIEHPIFGNYLIDTGVAQRFAQHPEQYGIGSILYDALELEHLKVAHSTDQILSQLDAPIQGIFLTHLHIDHILGLPAISTQVPLYTGKGEASAQSMLNIATQPITNSLLAGRPEIQEWQHEFVDIFGDASVFAWHLPGHTPGSTAYIVNSSTGPVLITGDVCHTRWGWQHNVEPGNFSLDIEQNRKSLATLRAFSASHPQVTVRLGHQD